MSAQKAAPPAKLAAVAAAIVLVAVAAIVAVRLIGHREPARPAAPSPPGPGRVVDRKERVLHQEFREGRLVAEVRGDTFSLGPDGRNRLQGSVEVLRYGPGGEVGSRLTADEVVYDKGSLVYTITGRVRVEAGGVVLDGDSFVYDQTGGLFTTRSGGAFSSRALKGRAKELSYAEGREEIRLSGGVRVETSAAGFRGGTVTVSGETLTYVRRESRGRVEGNARLEGEDLRGAAAAAVFVGSESGSGLESAALEGEAGVALDAKGASSGPRLEIEADRIEMAFSGEPSCVALRASGRSRFDLRSAPDRTMTVLAPMAELNSYQNEGRLTWHAWGGVRAETAGGGMDRAIEGEEAVFDSNEGLDVRGGKDRPAVADAADLRIEAAGILTDQATGDVLATGGASGVLKGGEGRRTAGLFSAGEDVVFSCRVLKRRAGNSILLFTGNVLARQGADAVRADELEMACESGRMTGRGSVEIALTKEGENGAPARTVVMGGREMSYRSEARTLSFAGKVFVELPEARLEAGRCSAVIGPEGRGLESLAAEAEVSLFKGDYLGRGETAVYEAAKDRIVLSGKPVLTDGQGGSARGDKLTFDLADDKILVENEGSARSATVIRS